MQYRVRFMTTDDPNDIIFTASEPINNNLSKALTILAKVKTKVPKAWVEYRKGFGLPWAKLGERE